MKSRTWITLFLACLFVINIVIQLLAFPVLARKKEGKIYIQQTMRVLLNSESSQDKESLQASVQRAIFIYTRVWDRLELCVSLSFAMLFIIGGGLFYMVRQGLANATPSSPS